MHHFLENDKSFHSVDQVRLLSVSRRLRHRPAARLPSDPQRVRVREPLQVRRLHGHATRQMVQGGALREACLRCDRGK